jgi:hypothetical protein
MKGPLSFVVEMKMEFEFIQVNLNGMFRIFHHFSPTGSDYESGFFSGLGRNVKNNMTVRTVIFTSER